jgi:hypothetical protein
MGKPAGCDIGHIGELGYILIPFFLNRAVVGHISSLFNPRFLEDSFCKAPYVLIPVKGNRNRAAAGFDKDMMGAVDSIQYPAMGL